MRRLSHLLLMYGFVTFVVTTAIMIFGYSAQGTATPAALPMLWHIGALMVCAGGYWFWFFIRVDVSAEGLTWFRVERADLFILSLLATTTFALIWSYMQFRGIPFWTTVIFGVFIAASTVLFGGVLWSKFAHMFFKPAAALQKRIAHADGSAENLPAEYDPADPAVHQRYPDVLEYMGKNPPNMGLCIKAEKPNHY